MIPFKTKIRKSNFYKFSFTFTETSLEKNYLFKKNFIGFFAPWNCKLFDSIIKLY